LLECPPTFTNPNNKQFTIPTKRGWIIRSGNAPSTSGSRHHRASGLYLLFGMEGKQEQDQQQKLPAVPNSQFLNQMQVQERQEERSHNRKAQTYLLSFAL
jgi:hypothetical protein